MSNTKKISRKNFFQTFENCIKKFKQLKSVFGPIKSCRIWLENAVENRKKKLGPSKVEKLFKN